MVNRAPLRVALAGREGEGRSGAAEAGRLADELGSACDGAPIIFTAIDEPVTRERSAAHHLVVGGEGLANPWVDAVVDPDMVRELAEQRLVPWVTRWQEGRRAPRAQVARLSDPNPGWPASAARLIARLEAVTAGQPIRRIDHIGSTSVAELPAKDLIDIQILVATETEAAAVAEAAVEAGFVWVTGQWHGKDRSGGLHLEQVCVDADPGRPVNINIRSDDAPVGRDALLFRDWLRAVPEARTRYLALKSELVGGAIDDYGTAKEPFISSALDEAEIWARETRWTH